ncbi:DUF1194 domain-containing protein [Aliiroseovarius sp. YM-037]|uniref:DUF1194 domain-containing protein n=1 Tax=Aliiroseovarius sp. YM-037 TaxID=3341728 RepID=UPI003A805904
MARIGFFLRVFILGVWLAQMAQAQSCRHALVLALDVSGSVNSTEYAQQVNGLAAALNDPDVRSLILFSADAPIAVTVFEWSSRNHQFVIQPWISLDGPAALDRVIARIRSHQKVRAGLKTAIGTALSFGAVLLEEQEQCWQRTIDVSGDGTNNIGITPTEAYRTGAFDGITVNALVVNDPASTTIAGTSSSSEALKNYYEDEVIHGPLAFTMVANGYADYAAAMQRKLMRELSPPIFGELRD